MATLKKQWDVPQGNKSEPEKLPDAFPERMSIEQMRKIWNDENRTYQDKELYRIREWLYTMATMLWDIADQNDLKLLKERFDSDTTELRKGCLIFNEDMEKAA